MATTKQRRRRHERRLAHQAKTRNARWDVGLPSLASAPPKRRARTVSKRYLRKIGRKIRPERY